MSDQTPNSTEDLNGSEPSMEDILASIRKIISEDKPVALESPEDSAIADIVSSEFGHAPNNLVSDAVADTQLASLAEIDVTDGGVVDLNIDDVLAGLDDDLLADEAVKVAEVAGNEPFLQDITGLQDITDIQEIGNADSIAGDYQSSDLETEDDILAFLDSGSPLESDANVSDISVADVSEELSAVEDLVLPASDIDTEAVDFASLETNISTEDAEMDALLDDILMTSEEDVMDFAPDELEDHDTEALSALDDDLLVSEEDSDLDLVKSLMADLADDPGSMDTEDDLDALLQIPELDESEEIFEDMEAFADTPVETADFNEDILAADEDFVAADALETEDEDVLGDILDMTLDDELKSHPNDIDLDELMDFDDVAAAEQDNILENALDVATPEIDVAPDFDTAPVFDTANGADTSLSLSDIAAAAEADAVAVEASTFMAAAAGTAAAGVGLTALVAKVAEPETDTSDTLQVEADTVPLETQVVETQAAESSAVETITETSQSLSHQETRMPVKAVKSDAILDDVTEAATAGAFAELNTVVEDKAIFNERGPRIGDLVQEALRPMLKDWLDSNLKGIVERAVAKEVKRISSGK